MTLAGKSFLLAASLFFYSWWNIAYLPLILTSMIVNYAIGTSFSQACSAKAIKKLSLLTFGIAANVGLLAYFKYSDFLIENLNNVFGGEVSLLHLTLPLAISFFTFQQIAYLVDAYKGQTREYDFLNYAVFVSFFPQLIAGPIVHHREMMPQFSRARNLLLNYNHIGCGLLLFAVGLCKKVVIADTFGLWADEGFAHPADLSFIQAWITSLSYTLQLYFDFSGYCDMAMGAALMFNIRLPINFNSPYKACNIQDFWRRWHITLGRFLKDYIYVPMGGNRHGFPRTALNLMITFFIGGLWHGAGWTFVLWGLAHGAALVLHRLWNATGIKIHKALSWFITFNFINIAWVLFRASSIEDAANILRSMVNFPMAGEVNMLIVALILFILLGVLRLPNSNALQRKEKIGIAEAVAIGGLFFIAFTTYEIRGSSEFLYFQF